MGSFLFGGSDSSVPDTSAQTQPSLYLRYSTSLQGRPRAIGWGRCRVAVNCTWFAGFHSVATTSTSGGSGGKGGLLSPPSVAPTTTTTYTYYVDTIFSLGDGPIAGVGNIYRNSNIHALQNATLFKGDYSQNVWSFTAAQFPTQALAYRGEAYLASVNFNLGSQSSLPNISAEVIWGVNVQGYDANPADVVLDFLTNAGYGVPNFDPTLLGDFTAYRNYCGALGMNLSTVLTSQTAANSFLQDIATATNSEFRWSSGLLSIVPYADANETGNGFTFVATTTPIYALTTDDFIVNQGTLGAGSLTGDTAVAIARLPRASLTNRMQVEYLDRGINYNPATVENFDEAAIIAYGDRPSGLKQMHMFAVKSAAAQSCALQLARAQIATTYQFTLGAKGILLDPMDIVTLNEPSLGLVNHPVRITEIQENDDATLTFTCDEYHGTVSAPLYNVQAGAATQIDFNADPGSINIPLIFEPPYLLAGELAVWCAVSAPNQGVWGGCNVWVSSDGTDYSMIGSLFGGSRMGFSTSRLPSVAAAISGPTIDPVNVVSVDLTESAGVLVSASQNDMLAGNTAMLIGNEVVAYQNANLTAPNTYGLGPLLRGAYDTAIADHPSGTPVVRLDNAIFKFAYTPDRIGAPIYLKFQSFNIYQGATQDLSVVAAVSYQISGSPLAAALAVPQNLRTVFSAGFEQLAWDEVSDFRSGIRYKIYRGDTAATAQQVGDLAHPPFTLVGGGTYYVVAYCQPTLGVSVISPPSSPVVITGNMLVANSLKTWDQTSEGWTGTLTNLALQGSAPAQFLALASGQMTGSYVIPAADQVDLGYVGVLALNVTWKAIGVPIGQNILGLADFLAQTDILGSSVAQYVDSFVEVQIGVPGSSDMFVSLDLFDEADIYLGVINRSPWQKFLPGNYLGRYANFRITIISTNPQVTGYLLSFVMQASVPTRIDHYQNLTVPVGGLTIQFVPDGATTAASFNGGPNNAPLPYVSITELTPQAGDVLQYSALTLSSVTLRVTNGGSPVARSAINVDVQGY